MDERGGATGVEMAMLWIAMLLLVLSTVQVALAFYAGQLALTAAEDGLRTGRYYNTTSPEAARRDAEAFLARAAGTALVDPAVTVAVDGGILRVTVTGEAPSVLPGVRIPVSRQAVGGVERVTP